MTRAFDTRIPVISPSNRLQTLGFCSTLYLSSIAWFILNSGEKMKRDCDDQKGEKTVFSRIGRESGKMSVGDKEGERRKEKMGRV
ncbi:hypothetical protein COLO4_04845 [Corchorus olitorius]|uniref:Uncharacterized protein n=1 Tax=Corchorus olitorius TaxID=93759 RepID=A0A1R3KSL8_9ROSI|nr:hypothetical protein COLO4_04845 [Corchorus olitorius]